MNDGQSSGLTVVTGLTEVSAILVQKMDLRLIIDNLRGKLLNYDRDFIDKYKIDELIARSKSEKNGFCINYADNDIVKNIEYVSKIYDDTCKYYLNKYIIVSLISNSLNLIDEYPEAIRKLFGERFNLIANDIVDNPDKPYDFDSDIFRKDISICCLNMFPVGALVVHVGGIGRIFMLKGGIKQFVNSSHFYLFRMRNNYPYYQMHADPRRLSEFTEEGWNKCYLRIAEMLKKHEHIRGINGGSWFYDPMVEKISPRLSYLRKIPLSNGARIFRSGVNESEAVKNATLTSETRRKLYFSGEYHPTSYEMIWMRDDVIKWANANQNILF